MDKLKELYEKMSQKERILLFAALGMIFIAVMDMAIIGPILSRMKEMDAQIVAMKDTISRNLRITSFKDSILQEYGEYESYLDSGEKTQEQIIGDLLKKIEMMATNHSMAIINIQPGDIEENPVFQVYKTALECEGTFDNLLSFMRDLEESDFLFMITSYSMTPKSKGGEVIHCLMNISRIFMAKEEGAEIITKMEIEEGQSP